MSEYIYLVGQEQVERAARQISDAAERIERSMSLLNETMHRYAQVTEEAVSRLEAAVEKKDSGE